MTRCLFVVVCVVAAVGAQLRDEQPVAAPGAQANAQPQQQQTVTNAPTTTTQTRSTAARQTAAEQQTTRAPTQQRQERTTTGQAAKAAEPTTLPPTQVAGSGKRGPGLQIQGDATAKHPATPTETKTNAKQAATSQVGEREDAEQGAFTLRKRPTKLGLKISSCTTDRFARRHCVQEALRTAGLAVNMSAIADCMDSCEARKAREQPETDATDPLVKFDRCVTNYKLECVRRAAKTVKFDDDIDMPVLTWGKGAWAADKEGDFIRQMMDYAKTCPGAEKCFIDTRAIGQDILKNTAKASAGIRTTLCKAHSECTPGKQCQTERLVVKDASCECSNNANSQKAFEACDNAEAAAARAAAKTALRIAQSTDGDEEQTQEEDGGERTPVHGRRSRQIQDQDEAQLNGEQQPRATTSAPRVFTVEITRRRGGPKDAVEMCRDNGADEIERPLICAKTKN